MNTEIGIISVAVVCGVVLLIGVLKRKAEFLLNFLVRTLVCVIAVCLINTFLSSRGIPVSIGLNLVSLLTFGTLGLCGMAALYGILFLQFL